MGDPGGASLKKTIPLLPLAERRGVIISPSELKVS